MSSKNTTSKPSTSGTSYGDDVDTLRTLRRPANSIADLVLQPHHYTTLLLQASADLDSNEKPSFPSSADPGTGTQSRETSLNAPPPTSFSHDSIRMATPPTIFVNDVDDVDSEANPSFTYDVILASSLHRNLGTTQGMKYLDIPATTTPLNSPAAIQEGGFGSLMGVSTAIMEGRM